MVSMSSVKRKKDEFPTTADRKSGSTTLAAVESLARPLEVVFLADFRCEKCQERVAGILSKMNGETQSVLISVLEKKVTLTCMYTAADKSSGRHGVGENRSSWSKIYSFFLH